MAIKTGYPPKTKEQQDAARANLEYNRSSIIVGDDAVLITFLDQGITQTTEETDPKTGEVRKVTTTIPMSVRVLKTDLPQTPKMPRAGLKIAECMVMWSKKDQKVLAIGPYNGTFLGIGVELGPKGTDGRPVSQPKEGVNEDGGKYKSLTFYCVYEITDDLDNNGLFIGSKPRLHMLNKFYEDNGMVNVMGKIEKAWRTRQLFEWGNTQDIFQDMPWPEDGNPLPAFQLRLQNMPKKVEVVVERGYVKDIHPIYGGGRIAEVKTVEADFPEQEQRLASSLTEPVKTEETTVTAENDAVFGDK